MATATEEIRIECLRLALLNSTQHTTPAKVVENAKIYESFIIEES